MIPKTTRLISWKGNLPETGDYLQTRKGSTYVVIGVVPNTRPNAKSVAKLHLLKLFPEDIAAISEDSRIHHFQWGTKA